MAAKFRLCLLLIILGGMSAYVGSSDLELCDQPNGVCIYHLDDCPPETPYECSQLYNCPLPTNKCCCYEPPPPTEPCDLPNALGYVSIGCYKDTEIRAITTLEKVDSILDGSYKDRVNPIAKCAAAAMRRGYSMFAVQDGGQCFASITAPMTFDKYGKSTACRNDGEGGHYANQVYVIEGYVSIGCYKDTEIRAITTLEGMDSILDGSYKDRVNSIAKCAAAAMRRRYSMFAVQDGGQCFASITAPMTFDKYGKSTACRNDGEGGHYANQVYAMKGARNSQLLL